MQARTLKTLFPKPKSLDEARRQANIAERACSLWQAGYDWYICDSDPQQFGVIGAQGQHYCVDLRLNRCSCVGFHKYGDCKHRIAIANTDACHDAAVCLEHELSAPTAEEEADGLFLLDCRAERLVREAGYCPL